MEPETILSSQTQPFQLIDLLVKGDARGSLIAIEENDTIPFQIKRVYYIFGTKPGVARGLHAHKRLRQLLVCTSGSCKMRLHDGEIESVISLDHPTKGLMIGPRIWREMFDFTSDCVLMVLASEHYETDDYISNFEDFLKYVKSLNA